jgi:hypothetical protein
VYLETLSEDVVRYRLANRMPIGDTVENDPPYELARTWLADKVKAREAREHTVFALAKETLGYTKMTYYAAMAALVATIVGIAITILHSSSS